MDRTRFKAKAYLKTDCPYSFKYLLFMAEARLLDRIEVVRCDPNGNGFERTKEMLADRTGRQATFPTVEIEPDRYLSDSDRLIDYYARANSVEPSELTALSFYKQGIFPQLEELHEST
jgi:hypothetical protein